MGTFWWGIVVGVVGTVARLATPAEMRDGHDSQRSVGRNV